MENRYLDRIARKNHLFKFKQFEVDQRDCAMKINTDGVLLAATAQEGTCILDIGTGTGVMAMMLAQRFPMSQIDAIDVDFKAARRAAYNFARCPFSERLHAYHQDLANFMPDNGLGAYDLIVSNPPFFENSLLNSNVKKSLARHAAPGFFDVLLDRSRRWLSQEGRLQLILPPQTCESVLVNVQERGGWIVHWKCPVFSFADSSQPIRWIISLGRVEDGVSSPSKPFISNPENDMFYIYECIGTYSDVYRTHLKDFFLAF